MMTPPAQPTLKPGTVLGGITYTYVTRPSGYAEINRLRRHSENGAVTDGGAMDARPD